MPKTRLEAFSDGVIAILITIMVLELKVPVGGSWDVLRPLLPTFLAYVLSFIYIGIYWSNHHHMLYATDHVNGGILWANLHLLFWLSLIPFTTSWMGQNHFASLPTAIYGVDLLCCALAYTLLQQLIINCEGADSPLRAAVKDDVKGKVCLCLYVASIPLAFVSPRISDVLYVVVAGVWLVPDTRIERQLAARSVRH
ncbi:MAG TPA: TMEM175 family protein [Gemmatimonadaceae bacterium]|jgi:uncharacterized membrane protein